jgi:hypothetical protein
VAHKVLSEARAGAVIALHDGRPGGLRTVLALDTVLRELRARALLPSALSEMRRRL